MLKRSEYFAANSHALKEALFHTVCIEHSYIARARLIATRTLLVRVLDKSSIAELLRTTTSVLVEVSTGKGMCLRGPAFIDIGSCVNGDDGQRFVEAVLTLENCEEESIEEVPSRWLT